MLLEKLDDKPGGETARIAKRAIEDESGAWEHARTLIDRNAEYEAAHRVSTLPIEAADALDRYQEHLRQRYSERARKKLLRTVVVRDDIGLIDPHACRVCEGLSGLEAPAGRRGPSACVQHRGGGARARTTRQQR
ncbi:MAG: hypothetical protein KIT84_08680 [Labilithrix sp.]|nr:hypothetical protein [Labilithrix sp.]